jgi:hypothetical protein
VSKYSDMGKKMGMDMISSWLFRKKSFQNQKFLNSLKIFLQSRKQKNAINLAKFPRILGVVAKIFVLKKLYETQQILSNFVNFFHFCKDNRVKD